MIRRLLLAAAVTGAAVLSMAPPAAAASPSGAWSQPAPDRTVDGVPVALLEEPGPLKGVADFEPGIASVSFRLTKDAAVGAADPCSAVDDVPPQVQNTQGTHVSFSFKATFPCNHRYQVAATITPQQRPLRSDTPTDLPLWIDVALPPAPTQGVVATPVGSRRAVSVRWDDASHEPDFVGFEIRRSVEGGSFEAIGTAEASATSFVDGDVPASGGELRYRVLGMRSGPRPGSTVYGQSADTGEASIDPAPGASADPGTGGGTDGSGGGTGSGSGDAGTGGRSRADTSGLHSALPSGGGRRTATGTYEPPTTPTTADTGFAETLPFQQRAQDGQALPAGDPAVVATIEDDDDTRRQTVLLVAGGGVAFSWAMALRFLSRRFSGV